MKIAQLFRPFAMTILLVFGCLTINAQMTSIPVDQEQQATMQQAHESDLGFKSIYFSSNDLNGLLNASSGVRFYTAQSPTDGSPTVVAVGLDASGNEKGAYLISDYNSATPISQESAKSSVEAVKASNYQLITCAFSKSDLETLMQTPDASGLNIQPGDIEGRSSLITTPAEMTENGPEGLGAQGMLAAAPCPTACRGGGLTTFE